MKKGLNARQKQFCLLRTSGMSQIEAYKKAGYKGGRDSASTLEANPNILKQIQILQEKAENQVFDLIKECQRLAPSAISELAELLKHKKAPHVQIRAIREVLDRGFGKPKEQIDETGFIDSFAELVKAAGEKENAD